MAVFWQLQVVIYAVESEQGLCAETGEGIIGPQLEKAQEDQCRRRVAESLDQDRAHAFLDLGPCRGRRGAHHWQQQEDAQDHHGEDHKDRLPRHECQQPLRQRRADHLPARSGGSDDRQ